MGDRILQMELTDYLCLWREEFERKIVGIVGKSSDFVSDFFHTIGSVDAEYVNSLRSSCCRL